MNLFLWFAVILTVGYIIYYTVMIMNDLYGKKAEVQNTTEEIDVPTNGDDAAIPDDSPIEVIESDDGFNIGEEEYEIKPAFDDNVDAEELKQVLLEESTPKPSVAENIVQHTDAYSEEIEVQFDDRYESVDFKESLLHGGELRKDRPKIELKQVIDEI